MNMFDEDINLLSRELIIIRYKQMLKYVEYLEVKVNEFEKYYNVETSLRQQTPSVSFSSQIEKCDAIEKVIIPERKFWVSKPYVKTANELIDKFLRGEQ